VKDDDLAGSLVLEKLALIGKVDAFYEAVDSDDLREAASLMRRARVDAETIAAVLKKIADGE
jgi:hypothetical protein